MATQVVEGEGVLLWGGGEHHLLTGRLFERMVPLLDAGRTVDELTDELADEFPPEQIFYGLIRLSELGVTRDGGDSACPAATAHWDALGIVPDQAVRRLQAYRVAVRTAGVRDTPDIAAGLMAAGLVVGPAGDLDVVVVDSYLRTDLAATNDQALASGRRWLPVKPIGPEFWIGPLFSPGVTACWTCLTHRIRQHQPVDAYFADQRHASPSPAQATHPATLRLAIGLLASTLADAIATDQIERLGDRLIAFDTVRGTLTRHRVVRRPQCQACGDPTLYTRQANTPPRLESRPKQPGPEHEQRSERLRQTYEVFRRHVGSPTGIITELVSHHAAGSPLIQAVSAGPVTSLRYRGLAGLRAGMGSTSGGKGVTRLRAKVSAMGEALERYSGTYHGDEPRTRGRLDDLEGAIHPNACMHFSAAQYAERSERNVTAGPADRIPPPFDPAQPTDWTPMWSLTTGRRAYLPTMLLYFDHPALPAERTCIATSNGAASGNGLEEAILHGLLELVERDAVAMWWYNRAIRPGVNLTGSRDPFVRRMHRAYASIGREWWVLDLTSDLGVPCYAAVSRRVGGGPEEPLLGFGAHLDPAIALRRAVTELNQIAVGREGRNTRFVTDRRVVDWLATASVARHPYLAPADTEPVSRGSTATGDVFDDLNQLLTRLQSVGLDPLVLDQTRPDIGVAVARVVVPELRAFRTRFAPGRLYDVPAGLGWIPRRPSEDELNPVAFVL